MKFELKSKGYDLDLYEYIPKSGRIKFMMFHRHEKYVNTVYFRKEEFILKDEYQGNFVPMDYEENEFVKYSCKYGHWQYSSDIELDLETLEFARKILLEGDKENSDDDR